MITKWLEECASLIKDAMTELKEIEAPSDGIFFLIILSNKL
jgi:hypothetical protein